MPKQTQVNYLDAALQLVDWGYNVLPAGIGEKSPLFAWTEYQKKRVDPKIRSWFTAMTARNYWSCTGSISGVIVLDCDSPQAETYWREKIPNLDDTVRVKTKKGHHFHFRLPPGQTWQSWSHHQDDNSFDVRSEGTGVVVPPSVHESGFVYHWEQSPSDVEMLPAPECLRKGSDVAESLRKASAGADGARDTTKTGGQTRSMLSSLLARPPKGGEGDGRNDWLTSVAGHYAKTYRKAEDLYRLHTGAALALMPQPLSDAEYIKTVDSVWRGEHERHPERGLGPETGWITSGGETMTIQTQVVIGKGEDAVYTLGEWADFDLVVNGVVEDRDDDGEQIYDVTLRRKFDQVEIPALLPAKTCGDSKKLGVWLAGYRVSISPPDGMTPRDGAPGTRLLRYLNAQDAPKAQMAPALGWDDTAAGFLTHDGVIRADGFHEFAGVRPDPMLRRSRRAPFHYGFERDAGIAREVLRDVLTFHDQEITAVFGAWWAACLVKPQIQARTALFPFVGIEASSGSGKTTGFFSLMSQMNGNIQGETQGTKASSRDGMSANRSGVVWMDDLDDTRYLHELLRTATAGGSMMKKGQDNSENVVVALVAPIVISGESLGLGSQKALLDRSLLLRPPVASGRRSAKGDYDQWEDILTLRAQFPGERGLAVIAGWYVQAALGQIDNIDRAIREAKQAGERSGRAGDKDAIIRAGACLLDFLIAEKGQEKAAWAGRGPNRQIVDKYLNREAADGFAAWDNTLTLELLPWVLRDTRWPGSHRSLPPAFVVGETDEGDLLTGAEVEIWFSPVLLAEAWDKSRHGRIEMRTESRDAITEQAKSAGFGGVTGEGRKQYRSERLGRQVYWRITGEAARAILDRSRGQR